MQFTPQQLRGGPRYGPKTRVGNWYEEKCLDDAKLQALRAGRRSGGGVSAARRAKLAKCNHPAALTFRQDRTLCYGDIIVLESSEVQGALACDPFEEMEQGASEYIVTVATTTDPVARTAFRVMPVQNPRLKDWRESTARETRSASALDTDVGAPVAFGEGFHLVCDAGLRIDERFGLRKPDLYLTSTLLTETRATKAGARQQVFLQKEPRSDTVWLFRHTVSGKGGAVKAAINEGMPVPIGEELVIEHRNTRTPLCCESQFRQYTDFGAEWEASCHMDVITARNTQLLNEVHGTRTAASAHKPELSTNRWVIRGADSEEESLETRDIPPAMSADDLIAAVLGAINKRANSSIRGLRRAFRSIDEAGDGKLDREDLRWGLVDFGVEFDEDQFTALIDHFDKNKDGFVSLEEFMSALRPPLNDRRLSLINAAYDALDVDGSGHVTVEDILMAYDLEAADSRYASGEISRDDAAREFLSLWDTQEKDGIISRKEFHLYYQELLAGIEDDDYVELLLRNAWHLSSGEGWCENSSCMRVLVTFTDGHDEVVEVCDDLGIRKGDTEKIIAQLEAQGVKGIERISTFGEA